MTELWSARYVALYLYCPRLFHRLVGGHEPDQALLERISPTCADLPPSAPALGARLWLTHPELGFADDVQLAESHGPQAVPLLLRRGAPCPAAAGLRPRNPHPSDAFLLALHALLLQRAGYDAPYGLVHYLDEDLTLRLPLDRLLRAQALELFDKARACAAGPQPEHACHACQNL
jgi:hypothetical protein